MKEEKQSISIRVNGKEVSIKEERPIVPPPNKVIDFSKIKEERNSLKAPFWDDGNRENSPKLPLMRKKRTAATTGSKNRFSWTLIAVVCSAVIVGLSLGWIVLSIFTGQANEAAHEPIDIPALFTGNEKIGLPLYEVAIVQGGAFSSIEKGEELRNALQNDGFAAALFNVDGDREQPIYLMIGLGKTKEQAELISDRYAERGQETYVKTYRIDGQVVQGQTMDVYGWFEDVLYCFDTLVDMTAKRLADSGESDETSLRQTEEALVTLDSEKDERLRSLQEEAKEEATALIKALLDAKNELESGDERALWRSEQHLLDALAHYETIVYIAK